MELDYMNMIRMGVISDLHVDESPGAIEATLRAARAAGIEALLVAGDLASGWRASLEAITRLEDGLGAAVLFVPGNHDLWNRDHPEETPELALDKLREHPGCLSGKRIELGGHCFVGECGWYDGSLAEGRFSTPEIQAMAYGGRTWQDSLFARWQCSMEERAANFLSNLETALHGLVPERTIAVTHVLPRLELTVQPPTGIWTYFNGLLGSAAYGDLFSRKGIRAAVCGHVHYRRTFKADGVEWLCRCLGTPEEWKLGGVEIEAAEALGILELGVHEP